MEKRYFMVAKRQRYVASNLEKPSHLSFRLSLLAARSHPDSYGRNQQIDLVRLKAFAFTSANRATTGIPVSATLSVGTESLCGSRLRCSWSTRHCPDSCLLLQPAKDVSK